MSIEEIVELAVQRGVEKALLKLRPVPSAPDELLSVPRAAELADVSAATIRRWVEQGLLKRYGSGRALRVRREELLNLRPPEAEGEVDIDALAAKLMNKAGG